ncbi:MAG: flavin reductase family protein [Dehalococcoidia bacterium]
METKVASVMDTMPYGLYIIGSRSGDDDGMMADWVMQVSFHPRLIAVAFENDARTLENIRSLGVFTVNMLSEDQQSMTLAARFAQPYSDSKIGGRASGVTARAHHKLADGTFTRADNGCAVLDGAMAWLECRAREFLPAGDHTLVVAEVTGGESRRDAEPLTSRYTGWNYSG